MNGYQLRCAEVISPLERGAELTKLGLYIYQYSDVLLIAITKVYLLIDFSTRKRAGRFQTSLVVV
jgi:hypothetical protein